METVTKRVKKQLKSLSSYRTYEEWKPIYVKDADNGVVGSYRTYEEWKQLSSSPKRLKTYMFLPYLWGMETNTK